MSLEDKTEGIIVGVIKLTVAVIPIVERGRELPVPGLVEIVQMREMAGIQISQVVINCALVQ